MEPPKRTPMQWALRIARVLAIAASVIIGLGFIVLAAAFGSCSAFGGSCPDGRPPLWDDDTFRIAASGAALMVGVPVFLYRPSWRQLAVALAAGAGAGLVVGLLVTTSAAGG